MATFGEILAISLTICLLLGCPPGTLGKKHYWWMNDPSVFGNGQSTNNNQLQQRPVANQNNQQHTPEQQYQNFPAVPQQQSNNGLSTECPVGTKCVQDIFCNENAIMVSYRVQLTHAQKNQRGVLPSCLISNNNIGVCCSTAPVQQAPAANNNFLPPQNQQQTQQAQPTVNVPTNNFNNNAGPAPAVNIPTGTCPQISALPNIAVCQGKESNCWSVNQADVDCPDNALCCFDGCVNACYFGDRVMSDNPPPLTTPASAPAPPRQNPVPPPQNQFQAPQQQAQPSIPAASYVPAPAPAPAPAPRPAPAPAPRPAPAPAPRPKPVRKQKPKQKPQRPNNVVNQVFVQSPGSGNGAYNGPDADSKPFVMCPAAMLCIPRQNCDFKGFITDQTLNLTPDLEMLRVPLIPCVNPDNQNIDVCCRDPNYVDPWPQNMNKNGGQAMMAPQPPPQQQNPQQQQRPINNNNQQQQQPINNNNQQQQIAGINPRLGQQKKRGNGGYGK